MSPNRKEKSSGLNKMPYHVAIIMDGNGRWAKNRGLPRNMGHRAGIKTVEKIIKTCKELEIKVLTLYVFSTENWKRPKPEVDTLMHLLAQYIQDKSKDLIDNNIKLVTIGDTEVLPEFVKTNLNKVIRQTLNNDSLTLVLAINYGGRSEILKAVRKVAKKVKSGQMHLEDIDEKSFSGFLYTAHLPDPDLLIRTGGEYRLSNFLLWQASYSEIYITDKLWPDFDGEDLKEAIKEYQKRERKFGEIRE